MIHETGRRRGRNFVAINCAGLPDSLLESELFGHTRGSFTGAYRDKPGLAQMADNGTLFLDELGEMSLRMQALLLRFVESGEIQRVGSDRIDGRVNVRIVAATNRNLSERITNGDFREDLYYRLNVIRLTIPPLRERGADVAILLEHYLAETAKTHRVAAPHLAAEAQEMLTSYRWPGNVRELKNVVERVVVRHAGREIRPEDLPSEILEAVTFAPQTIAASMPAPSQNARRDRVGPDAGEGRELLDGRLSRLHRPGAHQDGASPVDQDRPAADTRQLPQARGAVRNEAD